MPNEHVSNPFVDFKYGDNYASDFHLIRTSDSKRYNDNLIPTLTDKTAEVPGADGMYFFNTYYKQRQFTLNLAYDSLTEEDLRAVRNWLNGKDIKPLIFDERPDRQYYAKVTGTPQFKYIPFDQPVEYRSSNNTQDNTITLYAQVVTNPSVITTQQWSELDVFVSGDTNNTTVTFSNHGTTIGILTWDQCDPVIDQVDIARELLSDEDLQSITTLSWISLNPRPSATQVVMKGEGSVQFTCYDPFAYSVESYQQETEVQGELPAYFTVTKTGNIDIGEQWSIYNTESQTPIYTIQFTSSPPGIHSNDYTVWDSRTGMVARYNTTYQWVHNPLSYVGQGMGTLEIGHTYTVSGNGQLALAYHNRYY